MPAADISKMWIMWINVFCARKNGEKNPHSGVEKLSHLNVDNVGKSVFEKVFANIYNISGAHSYQQISVHTIFFQIFFNFFKGRKIEAFIL